MEARRRLSVASSWANSTVSCWSGDEAQKASLDWRAGWAMSELTNSHSTSTKSPRR